MAESGSVAGLVAKWRIDATKEHSGAVWQRDEGHMSDEEYAMSAARMGQLESCSDELEAALAKDELRVAAVELAKEALAVGFVDHDPLTVSAARVLRLAGEA